MITWRTLLTVTLHHDAMTGKGTPREYMSSHSCLLSQAAAGYSSSEQQVIKAHGSAPPCDQ